MVYTGKRNGKHSSSVIEIPLTELDEVIEGIERKIMEINEGLEKKTPLYHPGNIKEYKVPSAECVDFWYDESTYYSPSGKC